MHSIDNFQKLFVISVVSIAKPKNIVVFAFTYVLENSVLFYCDFCMDFYSVDSDEAMKWWSDEAMKWWSDEVMKWWSDEARWWSVKHFIASIFKQR